MNCYNGEKYLSAAINSVLSQSYTEWEIIFWDNQSTDGSASIVQSYSEPRIKYFYAPKHTPLYEARNFAVKNASGKFLAFLDVDDLWLPNKLELQINLFADPEVGFSCGNYWIESERKDRRWLAFRGRLPEGLVLDELLKFYFVGLVTLMVRRTAFDLLPQPFDPRYHIIGDMDLVIRLAMTWKLAAIQRPVAIYRLHANNESSRHRDKHADELELWSSEMSKSEAIGLSQNSHFIMSHFAYIKAMNFALQGNKLGAYSLMKELPWGRLKLRILASIILPLFVVRRLKN